MKRRDLAIFTFIAAVALPPGVADAGPQFQCCTPGQVVRWNVPGSDLIMRTPLATGSIWRTRMANAASGWSNFIGSALNIQLESDAGNQAGGNQENEMYFVNAPNPNNVLALETTDYTNIPGCVTEPCCFSNPCSASSIIESDIRFFLNFGSGSAIPWSSALPANLVGTLGYGATYFGLVASHELGHTVGLADLPNQGMARMFGDTGDGGWYHASTTDTDKLDVLALERYWIRSMYPAAGTVSDVYATNMQASTSGNSVHLSYDPETNSSSAFPRRNPVLGGAFQDRDARVGDRVDFRICWGNLGNLAAGTVPIHLYLSTDDNIDAGDAQPVNNWSVASVSAHAFTCSTINLTVPNVSPGDYNIMYNMRQTNTTIGNGVGIVNRILRVVP